MIKCSGTNLSLHLNCSAAGTQAVVVSSFSLEHCTHTRAGTNVKKILIRACMIDLDTIWRCLYSCLGDVIAQLIRFIWQEVHNLTDSTGRTTVLEAYRCDYAGCGKLFQGRGALHTHQVRVAIFYKKTHAYFEYAHFLSKMKGLALRRGGISDDRKKASIFPWTFPTRFEMARSLLRLPGNESGRIPMPFSQVSLYSWLYLYYPYCL